MNAGLSKRTPPMDVKEICERFTHQLQCRVGILRSLGVHAAPRHRIEKLAVFLALEDCKRILERDSDFRPAVCRFSMDEPKDTTLAELRKALGRSGAESKLLHRAKRRLREYLIDFSFSRFSIPQAIGKGRHPIPQDQTFEFLLTAESEMGGKFDVLRDFLKLLIVRSRTKIMVFQAPRTKRATDNLIDGFQIILARDAGVFRPHDSQWLFVGIPNYAQWLATWEAPERLVKLVFVLDPDKKEPSLVRHDEWWNW